MLYRKKECVLLEWGAKPQLTTDVVSTLLLCSLTKISPLQWTKSQITQCFVLQTKFGYSHLGSSCAAKISRKLIRWGLTVIRIKRVKCKCKLLCGKSQLKWFQRIEKGPFHYVTKFDPTKFLKGARVCQRNGEWLRTCRDEFKDGEIEKR